MEGAIIREGEAIAEMLWLYDNNESGCVVGFWRMRSIDGELFPEFCEVHDRLTQNVFDNGDVLLEALKWGRTMIATYLSSDLIDPELLSTHKKEGEEE